jgi:hypothetical protein
VTAPTPDTSTPLVERHQPLPSAGRAPTAAPPAAAIAVLLALSMLAAGVVALRDAAVSWGWVQGTRWTDLAITHIDGLRFHGPILGAGALAVAVGAWMIAGALRRRPRTAVALVAPTSVWTPTRDIARIASHTAGTVAGVIHVRAKATRRKIVVTAELADPAISAEVKCAITTALEDVNTIFVQPLRLRVRVKEGTSR